MDRTKIRQGKANPSYKSQTCKQTAPHTVFFRGTMKLSSRSLLLLAPAFRSTFALATVASKAGTGVHKPVGKDGEGEYSAATKGCFDVIDTATPPILQEICKQDVISSQRAYHIADYGTADAGTSLGLLSRMVKTVREHNKNDEQEVVLHYEDQLTNEWQVCDYTQNRMKTISPLLC